MSRAPVALPLVCFVAGACTATRAAEPKRPPPVPVTLAPVESTPLRETSELVAMLKSRQSTQLQPQVDGHVTRIFVVSGQRVAAGTVLMQIDPARQRATVDSQQASRQSKLAAVAYWRNQVARLNRVFAAGGASAQELDQARSSLRTAEADLASSAAQVQAETVQLRYYQVVAPGPGIVGDIPVRVGDLVTPQTPLTTLDREGALEAYVAIPLEQAGRLRLGLPVEILDASGARLAPSQVTFISPRAASDTQSVLIKAEVDNHDGRLRDAQFVYARVIWDEHAGPSVPVVAVQTRNGQTFAWVAEKTADGSLVAQQRAVQVGPIQGQRYPVLRGLAVGDQVVVSGVQKLRPGAPITAAPAGPSPPAASR